MQDASLLGPGGWCGSILVGCHVTKFPWSLLIGVWNKAHSWTFLDLLIINSDWIYFWIIDSLFLTYMTWNMWWLTSTENLIPQPDKARLGWRPLFVLVCGFYHKVVVEPESWVNNLSFCANLLVVLNPWWWGLLSWGMMVCAMTSWWSWESCPNCWLFVVG